MNTKREEYILIDYIPDCVYNVIKGSAAFIAGGAITSVFSGTKINDIDLYPKTEDALCSIKEKLDSLVKQEKGVLVITTANALTYRFSNVVIQLIRFSDAFKEDINSIFDLFDYTVCMGAYDLDSKEFKLHDSFLQHIAQKRLVFNPNTKFPISSLIRSKKYMNRGYSLSSLDSIKLGLAINNLKIETYRDLKDQLEGIDTLILKELTDKLMDNPETTYDLTESLELLEKEFEKYYSKYTA